MKKLLLLFVVIMSACTHKTQPTVEEDSVIENVVDTINSIVSNDSIQ